MLCLHLLTAGESECGVCFALGVPLLTTTTHTQKGVLQARARRVRARRRRRRDRAVELVRVCCVLCCVLCCVMRAVLCAVLLLLLLLRCCAAPTSI